jgi:drug/metabolite transporter (DMT)-like permease
MSGQGKIIAGVSCAIGAGALWGLVFLAPAVARSFTPLQLAAGRYLAYGLFAAMLLAPRWQRLAAALGRREWRALFGLSLLGNTFYFVMLASAVQWGGIAMTSLVIGFLPVAVTIIGSRDHGAVSLARLWPSLALSAAGIGCIGWNALTHGGGTASPAPLAGFACAIGALASWTGFAVWNSRCLERLHHVTPSDWSLVTGVVTGAQAVLLIPPAMTIGATAHDAAGWTQFILVSSGIAIFASILGNALWNRMSRLLPLTLLGQMILFETLFALLYAFLWNRRLPTTAEGIAILLVVASVLSCVAAHRGHGGTAEPLPA